MLKMVPLDRAINEKCCSVDGGWDICPLFFLPHPRGFDSSRIPTPREFAIQGKKKCLCPGAARGLGGGGWQAQLELTDALYEHFHVPGKSRLG